MQGVIKNMNKPSQLAKEAILQHNISALKKALSIVSSFSHIRIDDDETGVNGMTVMEFAAIQNDVEIVEFIFERYGIETLKGNELIFAAGLGCIDVVKKLILWKDDVNRVGYIEFTPLKYAVQEGETEVVKRLLEAGADRWQCDWEGKSLLYVAASEGHNEIVKLLLADIPDQQRYHLTDAFIIAGVWDNFEAVKLILDAGVDINNTDSDGRPLLFYALVYNKKELVDFLLQNGASLDIIDNYGVSTRRMYEDSEYLHKISRKIRAGKL